ncbi:hypothetical protein CoHVHLJ_130 [Columbid alphaherpesvirus 1]|uniref:Uncharacterized protein n=1 Tax=Columbid alphaherpesvirus 1 TaxID=93386 RepID=A0A1V0M8L1_9ALPH|nr:hypothetical protein CoHVHLJ_086 [Columbid alphaherpesvirus 1]YP_009353024.1 hypothetical protein CoHVHLJ_130 [Columbid alphaherpesvirus 1]ARD71397.1 hypothetical protein CoHVHLJ_086 [Columbid alphaherpesvirus 1]ARD71441.1 hypothetical protein CoHVHLJ_130 [Columbid alphaherpesvirus 1]
MKSRPPTPLQVASRHQVSPDTVARTYLRDSRTADIQTPIWGTGSVPSPDPRFPRLRPGPPEVPAAALRPYDRGRGGQRAQTRRRGRPGACSHRLALGASRFSKAPRSPPEDSAPETDGVRALPRPARLPRTPSTARTPAISRPGEGSVNSFIKYDRFRRPG